MDGMLDFFRSGGSAVSEILDIILQLVKDILNSATGGLRFPTILMGDRHLPSSSCATKMSKCRHSFRNFLLIFSTENFPIMIKLCDCYSLTVQSSTSCLHCTTGHVLTAFIMNKFVLM